MTPQAQAKYDRAIASILRHGGVKQLPGEEQTIPLKRCYVCGRTKPESEFHPEPEIFSECISCWLGRPGQHGPSER